MDRILTDPHERAAMPEVAGRDDFIRAQAALVPKGSWVLDAGAGASKYRPFFSHCRYETQDFCKYEGPLVKYLEPMTYVSEITAIPIPDSSLDVVLCTEVFEHLVDPMAALREFHRLLKPGGRLIVTAPFVSYLHMLPYHFYTGFTKYWYMHWLPATGFEIKTFEGFGGPARSATAFLESFDRTWGEEIKKKSPIQRVIANAARAPIRLFWRFVLPRFYRRLDRSLGTELVCSTNFVVAEKVK